MITGIMPYIANVLGVPPVHAVDAEQEDVLRARTIVGQIPGGFDALSNVEDI